MKKKKKIVAMLMAMMLVGSCLAVKVKEEPSLPKAMFEKQELLAKPTLNPIQIDKDGIVYVAFTEKDAKALAEWVTDTEKKFKLQQLELDKLFQRYYQEKR